MKTKICFYSQLNSALPLTAIEAEILYTSVVRPEYNACIQV